MGFYFFFIKACDCESNITVESYILLEKKILNIVQEEESGQLTDLSTVEAAHDYIIYQVILLAKCSILLTPEDGDVLQLGDVRGGGWF